jgi:hypothetical protein
MNIAGGGGEAYALRLASTVADWSSATTSPPSGITDAVSASTIGIDAQVSTDGHGTLSTGAFSTTTNSDLLVAFMAYDGPPSTAQTATVSGAGLSWQLVQRANTQRGTAEIWAAKATSVLTSVTVSSQPANPPVQQWHGSLTVIAFTNAAQTGRVGQASASSGAQDVSLLGVAAGNWVYAVGNDENSATRRTPASGQVLVHQDPAAGGTYWVQSTAAPSTADGSVDIHDSAPTTDPWNYAAVEILATW